MLGPGVLGNAEVGALADTRAMRFMLHRILPGWGLGAAMRKLVHLCFGVIKTQRPYEPNYARIA